MLLLVMGSMCALSNSTLAGIPQSAFDYGLVQQMNDDFGDAVTSFSKAIQANPKDADAYRQRAKCYVHLKNYDKAMPDLDRALKLNPSDYKALAERGFCLLQQNKIKEGLVDCMHAAKIEHPDEYNVVAPGNLENIAKALTILNRKGEALLYKSRAKNMRLVTRALDFRETRRPDDAVSLCNQAIKNDPNEVSAYYVRGIIMLNTGHNEEAVEDFSKCLRICPAFICPRYFRADAYMQMNQPAKAADDYTILLQSGYRFVATHQTAETGRQREHFSGRDEEIISMSDLYYLRAKARVELKQTKLAMADYDQAAKLAPNDPEPTNRKGELQASLGETSKAEKSLSLSSKINQKDWQLFTSRAQLYEKQKQYKKALELYSNIVQQFPKEAGAYFLRARLNEKLGDWKGAVHDYTKMIGLEGHDDDAYRCRADCYMKLGDFNNAEADYSMAMKLDPKNPALPALKKEAQHKSQGSRIGQPQ
jgi:tetratricopeptide (TPR) repeat protein